MNSFSQSQNSSAACGATPNRNKKEVHFVHLHAECLKDMKEVPFWTELKNSVLTSGRENDQPNRNEL